MDYVPSTRNQRIGLARALSKMGYCSRSQALDLIRAGRVQLNSTVRKDPQTPVHLGKDHIDVDQRSIVANEMMYLMLNKPRGIITSAADEQGRQTVYAYLGTDLPWVAPVGRLDKASEGLLLMTNDSEWAARVLAPETHLEKTYHVQVGIVAKPALLARMQEGLQAAGGGFLCVKRARLLRHGQRNSWLEIVLDEGKNRHIRRLLEALGIEVLRLVRVAIGPLVLGDLKKGECRTVTAAEKRLLDEAMRGSARGSLVRA